MSFYQSVAGCTSIAAFTPTLYYCKKLLQIAQNLPEIFFHISKQRFSSGS